MNSSDLKEVLWVVFLSKTVDDLVEEYFDEWHLEAGVTPMLSHFLDSGKSLDWVMQQAHETLSLFDELVIKRFDMGLDKRAIVYFSEAKPFGRHPLNVALREEDRIGKNVHPGMAKGPWEDWSVYDSIKSELDKLNNTVYLILCNNLNNGEDLQLLLHYKLRRNFVLSLRGFGLDLDPNYPQGSGPDLAILATGLSPTKEQLEMIDGNVALLSYLGLARGIMFYSHFSVPPEKVTITQERKVHWNKTVHHYYRAYSQYPGFPEEWAGKDYRMYAYAIYGGKVIGFVSGHSAPNTWMKYSHVQAIAIGEPYQRNEIGTRLLQEFERWLPDCINCITVSAIEDTRPFWERMGYKQTPGQVDGRNCIHLEKRLRII